MYCALEGWFPLRGSLAPASQLDLATDRHQQGTEGGRRRGWDSSPAPSLLLGLLCQRPCSSKTRAPASGPTPTASLSTGSCSTWLSPCPFKSRGGYISLPLQVSGSLNVSYWLPYCLPRHFLLIIPSLNPLWNPSKGSLLFLTDNESCQELDNNDYLLNTYCVLETSMLFYLIFTSAHELCMVYVHFLDEERHRDVKYLAQYHVSLLVRQLINPRSLDSKIYPLFNASCHWVNPYSCLICQTLETHKRLY